MAQNVSIEECPAELNKSSVTIACTDFALLQLRETAIREIENIYSLRDAPTVRRFIRSHSEVIAVLIEAQPRLLQHFGPNVKVALEVVTDPEGDETDQLFAYIVTELPADEATKRLDEFDEEWFLDQLDRTAGYLNFNLEFV